MSHPRQTLRLAVAAVAIGLLFLWAIGGLALALTGAALTDLGLTLVERRGLRRRIVAERPEQR